MACPWPHPQVNQANQIYDFIDKHINHLDTDLAELDAEIENDSRGLGLADGETAHSRLGHKLHTVRPGRSALHSLARALAQRTPTPDMLAPA